MNNKKQEYVQRIQSHYVGDDCIQVMIPYLEDSAISVISSKGMNYHYKPHSFLYVNKYPTDTRKEQFPYSQISQHKSVVRFNTIEYVNQLLDFNKVYITITKDTIKESYVIKDGDEALLATKFLVPNKKETKYVTREELLEILNTSNVEKFGFDGGYYKERGLATEERILEYYKEILIEKRELEANYNGNVISKDLTEYIHHTLDKLTIDDVPSELLLLDDTILVTIKNDDIKSVEAIAVKFMGPNRYKIESYDFPITIYHLEHMKKIEQENSRPIREPKFPRLLNKKLNRDEIRKEQQLVLSRKKQKKNTRQK